MAFIAWGITFCDTPKITIHIALSNFTCTLMPPRDTDLSPQSFQGIKKTDALCISPLPIRVIRENRVRSKIGEIYEICVRLFQHIAVLQWFKLTVLTSRITLPDSSERTVCHCPAGTFRATTGPLGLNSMVSLQILSRSTLVAHSQRVLRTHHNTPIPVCLSGTPPFQKSFTRFTWPAPVVPSNRGNLRSD